LIISCTAGQAQKSAVDALRRFRPSTNWNIASARIADVDCDSKPDTIILGSEKGKVVVGVVWGARKQPQVLVFSIHSASQDGFCAAPKEIEITPLDCDSDVGTLPGCKVAKECKAFSLNDHACDPFNFYWDAAQQRLAWWRL
jgi:hypothetical protein